MTTSQEPIYDGLKPDQIIGPDHHQFKLTSLLQPNRFGQLWYAEDLSTSRQVPVTLQIFEPSLLKYQGFIDSAQKHIVLSKKFKHPHLAEYYGMFRHKGVLLFFAMELMDGLTLDKLINSGQISKLKDNQKKGLLQQLATATDNAHAGAGQAHKAICPESIYINKQGGVKLANFAFDEAMRTTGEMSNTPSSHLAYQAPESFHPAPVTMQADIYSFACIAYQLLSGKAPFLVTDDESTRVRKELKKPASLNAEQWALLQSGFATDPEERPHQACTLLKQMFDAEDKPSPQADEEIPEPLLAPEDGQGRRWRLPMTRWIKSALIFGFGFLLGFSIAFAIGLQNTNEVELALSQTQAALQKVQTDIADLQTTLRLEREQRTLETDALQSELNHKIDEVNTLHKDLLNAKFADPDKLTVFTDQLDDGFKGPQMIIMPRGLFTMGDQKLVGDDNELPAHQVTISHRFALSRNEVTFNDYDYYARSMGRPLPDDEGWGRGNRPVINVSWKDAKAYVQWLALLTGQPYRLPTEAEWEYAARAGTDTNYWWGDQLEPQRAVCGECGTEWDGKKTAPVASFPPNSWGIHDMNGNVDEWVEDCYQDSYFGAPNDGSAMIDGDCDFRVMRGGSWFDIGRVIRSSSRYRYLPDSSKNSWGFRIALDLSDKIAEE
ncbi:SUMF1/EgtB/PvdO family nonheme iron enzyme [Amphritea sp. 2_MG-2023]|uniref:SUMF1/EgtB/PvdO family nonheme iron enzyme n=1 Tax=Amphritea TaxID=515417 RepID=UPI001C06911E|nr:MULTISPECIES: SUMF1/EgtB/PvdO family nonheme iron enzyme [Amphritea]MBU2965404.1 SUMF1/EgtB/PvdO family nonheme iron enzyme [Amphritea atlantica]MDO6420694.1 SUMF1/EgtB/PvdO family nonheme iron enzyme [Amphritea sp. 2_MG-2023]